MANKQQHAWWRGIHNHVPTYGNTRTHLQNWSDNGHVGDQVHVQNNATGNDRYGWLLFKFMASGAEAWIRSDLIDKADPLPAWSWTLSSVAASRFPQELQ